MPDDVPDDLDERLWFEQFGCTSRHFLMNGNPMILGVMWAFCPVERLVIRVSKSDLGAMSDEARYFVQGFLAGSEPESPVARTGIFTAADEEALQAWRNATGSWRTSGVWTMPTTT
jgi:hypothetical protein